ncbi:hypothetical protein SAMD00019534_032720 [Acytostelium subglobosum LB1]|uniref:hypothetical protein n=1 Tax=Acytostelium subglobosum LB1 TaxID=1410327 RepID=UPI0006451B95|nr:hypothetical protein SAMD00019534_032720 [Acytostelium subglobosum LB1]GAM20097.1 hypothetical protein SAMD00019534_032720 [Acytostelium subglobosum LB1]|eukprot:XP_012756859.1 hypothetical protein SAMD00019534_032720 [Acytostelium subglobosum LB1]
MKLSSLGLTPSSSCYLLHFKNCRILLDCSLECTSLLQFLPVSPVVNCKSTATSTSTASTASTSSTSTTDNSLKNSSCFKSINNIVYIDAGIKYHTPQFDLIDFATVDIILLSNYTNLFALPYITEYTSFNGKIYATEPSVQLGKLLLDEMIQYDKHNKTSRNQHWQSSSLLKQIGAAQAHSAFKYAPHWRELYNNLDTEKCFEKVQTVRFNEHLHFYGFSIRAVSSGYCLGGSNWIVESSSEKFVYLSDSSHYSSRYPEPLDRESIAKPDVLLVAKMAQYQLPFGDAIQELLSTIGSTLSSGGNVLIPTYSCGTVLDLFEPLSEYLSKVGLTFANMYYCSPVSKSVLSYADIYSEWLSRAKKERSYMPEAPFLHQDMIRNQHFTPLQHISSNFLPKDGSVMFVGHPSCRMGDVVHMINLWGENPKNAILFIEPEYDFKKTLLPFGNLQCRVQFIPIDPRLGHSEANDLIQELSPSTLLIPYQYQYALKNKQSNGREGVTTILNPTDVIKVQSNNRQRFEHGHIDSSLAQQIQPKTLFENNTSNNGEDSITVAQVEAVLSLNDSQYVLSNPTFSDRSRLSHWKEKLLWGTLSVEAIIKQLGVKGFKNVTTDMESESSRLNSNASATITIRHVVAGKQEETIVRLSPSNASIETCSEETRRTIMDIIAESLINL